MKKRLEKGRPDIKLKTAGLDYLNEMKEGGERSDEQRVELENNYHTFLKTHLTFLTLPN